MSLDRGSLDLSKLRARLEARKPKSAAPKARKGGRKPPPEPVVRRQEEQRALLEAAQARHRAKLAEATNTYPPLAKYLKTLNLELGNTTIITPGLVDLDLEHLVCGLGLHELPHDVRFLALVESMEWIKQVHKRWSRSTDITPYEHLFDARFVDSLSEVRGALRLH
jgi:hypothetical protein